MLRLLDYRVPTVSEDRLSALGGRCFDNRSTCDRETYGVRDPPAQDRGTRDLRGNGSRETPRREFVEPVFLLVSDKVRARFTARGFRIRSFLSSRGHRTPTGTAFVVAALPILADYTARVRVVRVIRSRVRFFYMCDC